MWGTTASLKKGDAMARIRVFLLTYDRPQLLRRALRSVLRQTMHVWVCELHNDQPDDDSPAVALAEIAPGDARFHYHRHARTWGAVAVFNHAFAGGPEPYASILEDDNWWEPDFLARTLAVLEAHPAAALVWANMRLWREEADGHWTDTGRTIWQCAPGAAPRRFPGPVALQAVDALHSNGAMICRTALSSRALVPARTPFAIIEQVRERLLPGELVFLPEVLAHFGMTRATTRSQDRAQWLQCQLLVMESFFARAHPHPAVIAALWRECRQLRPRSTDSLLLGCLCGAVPASLLRHANAGDWWYFLPRALRRVVTVGRALRYRQAHAELRRLLLEAAPPAPATDVDPLIAKVLPGNPE
jgi:hypothetical protein